MPERAMMRKLRYIVDSRSGVSNEKLRSTYKYERRLSTHGGGIRLERNVHDQIIYLYMRKLNIGLITMLVLVAACSGVQAQQQKQQQDTSSANYHYKKGVQKTGKQIKKGAKSAGDKTAETATKGASYVKDQVYKDKVGPDGETIFIDNESRYYYVDKKGKKVHVEKSSLKDKDDQ